jgi:hypothetical protein
VTAFLLARGADPLRACNGVPVVVEAEECGHWLAADIMRAWIRRGPALVTNQVTSTRMIYRIDGKGLVVTVVDVVHRRDAHRA